MQSLPAEINQALEEELDIIMKSVRINFRVCVAKTGKNLKDIANSKGFCSTDISAYLNSDRPTLRTLQKMAIIANTTVMNLIAPIEED